VVNEPTSGYPTEPPCRELPVSIAFIYLAYRVLNKESPRSRFPSQSSVRKRYSISRALLQIISQSSR
jgi:hypothetical protein